MSLKNKIISLVIALATIVSFESCEKKENTADNNILNDMPLNTEERNQEENKYDFIARKLKENLYEDNLPIDNIIYNYINIDSDIIVDRDLYIKALYMKLYNTDVPMSTYIKEMETFLIFQQTPTEVSEEVWVENFGNLLNVPIQYSSLYETFMDLAIYSHELGCNFEHVFDYAYTCEELRKKYLILSK